MVSATFLWRPSTRMLCHQSEKPGSIWRCAHRQTGMSCSSCPPEAPRELRQEANSFFFCPLSHFLSLVLRPAISSKANTVASQWPALMWWAAPASSRWQLSSCGRCLQDCPLLVLSGSFSLHGWTPQFNRLSLNNQLGCSLYWWSKIWIQSSGIVAGFSGSVTKSCKVIRWNTLETHSRNHWLLKPTA